MKHQKWLAAPLALAFFVGVTGAAWSQPGPGGNPGGGFGGPGGRGGAGGRGNFQNMTPEQRQQMQQQMQQMREQNLRMALTTAGFTDPKIQDPIAAFVREQEAAVQPLRQKGQQLALALQNPAIADAELTVILLEYNALVETETTRRTAARNTLREALKTALNVKDLNESPRLAAFLTMGGYLDEGMAYAGGGGGRGGRGGMMGGPGGFGGPGGPGGFGGQGGPGGFGGPGGPPPGGPGGGQ